jgi:single-stranded-DNA-specific exonuclease
LGLEIQFTMEHQNTKRWKVNASVDKDIVNDLASSLGLNSKLADLLAQRGVRTYEEAKKFFRPSMDDLHDPFMMHDMQKAVDRISKAMKSEQTIMIYGDYDVDGTTAVALMYSYLLPFFRERITFYIPDRYKEGYGISFEGIDRAKELDCKLIIALDCGIRSIDKVEYASNLGIDFIICDHHLPGKDLPGAIAVLDPKKENCTYPFKELSGAGIGFKLVQALEITIKSGTPIEEWLDLVTLSIAADIVPMIGENRILAYYGLKQINMAPRMGVKALVNNPKNGGDHLVNKEITITDLVFTVAPRINAAGRIDHGKKAVELLTTVNQVDIADVLQHLNEQNTTRRELDKLMTEEALAMIEASEKLRNSKSTLLFKKHWHKGVVGIVASRVIERYYRPTIILTESNGKATGSARSVKNFDVHEAISSCADLLDQFGGHMYAAGMTLPLENVDEFQKRFEEYCSANLTEEQMQEEIEIDLELEPSEITPKFYRILKQFAPFGPGNMAPLFLTKSLMDDGNSKLVGGNHLKMRLNKPNQPYFDAIAFNKGNHLKAVEKRIPIDVCYALDENHWNGKVTLQWMVKDIKV